MKYIFPIIGTLTLVFAFMGYYAKPCEANFSVNVNDITRGQESERSIASINARHCRMDFTKRSKADRNKSRLLPYPWMAKIQLSFN